MDTEQTTITKIDVPITNLMDASVKLVVAAIPACFLATALYLLFSYAIGCLQEWMVR